MRVGTPAADLTTNDDRAGVTCTERYLGSSVEKGHGSWSRSLSVGSIPKLSISVGAPTVSRTVVNQGAGVTSANRDLERAEVDRRRGRWNSRRDSLSNARIREDRSKACYR